MLTVRISSPYLFDKEKVNFIFDEGSAGCTINFDGLVVRPISSAHDNGNLSFSSSDLQMGDEIIV